MTIIDEKEQFSSYLTCIMPKTWTSVINDNKLYTDSCIILQLQFYMNIIRIKSQLSRSIQYKRPKLLLHRFFSRSIYKELKYRKLQVILHLLVKNSTRHSKIIIIIYLNISTTY